MRRQRGLTLLEVLVAVAIFAGMYVAAQIFFNSALDGRGNLERNAAELESMQRTLLMLTQDVEQMVARPVRDAFGDHQPAVRGDDAYMELTRLGWANPFDLRQRSQMQRVAWLLDDGRLIRRYWPTEDTDVGVEPRDVVLLEGVESFTVRFLDQTADGRWQWLEFWPDVELSQVPPLFQRLPRSIEVDIQLENGRSLHRYFRTVFNPWELS